MSSMLGSSVFAYLPPISFEGTEFVPMTLVHHQSGGKYAGWELIDGTARVSGVGDGFNGGKALEIPADPLVQAHIRREIPWETNEPIAFIDLRVKPAANPEGSEAGFYANGSQFAFQKSSGGTTGEIWVYDGNDGAVDSANDPEEWLEAPASFVLDSAGTSSADYIRITMRQDEIREVWDLFVNGQLAAANLRFDGREELLDAIHFFGGGQNAGDTLIDDLSADPDNMLFPDNDKDGLPNDWETANGSDPNLYDRDNISPNGKSWLERYVDSLWTAGKGAYGGPGQGSNGGGSIPPLNILELHEPVGALKGSLSVAGDGSASYTIPVDVPKGTAGMEPQISLNYSSNMPNGIAGLGWTVSGLQQITRGAATLQKDGFVDGVDFDGNDRFFFNGERLVCVAGTYGASGSEYRTEIDSFARITAIGTSGSGPLSWKVETKAGLVLSLGASSNSRVMVGTKGVLSWSVDKVEDTVGNYYAVSYESSPPIRTGEVRNYRVARIDYTGSATLAPYASISFEFEARPDVQSFYTAGLRQSFDERLKAIRVETGSYWNHSYELSYVSSEQTGRSLLTAVRKKGPSGSIPETTFRWQTVGHDDPKWREAGVLETQSYLIENEPGDESGSVAEVSPDSEHTLHLSGNAWRGVASPYVVTSDTWLEFEVRTDPEPGLLMIGLDDDLQSTDPGRLFTLVGAEPEAAGSDLYSSSGSWERKRIHVGQHYTGATNYLVLVNDCRAAGTSNGESWFRNVKLYEGDTDPFTVAPISFGFAAGIPTLTSNSDVNYGYEMADFDGDGFTDLLRASYTGKTQVGSYYELGSTVEAWKGGPAGLSSMTPPQHPFPVMTHMANAYWNMDGERHGYIHPFTDLDGDGVVDAGYSREISLPAYNTYSSTHSFAHFDGTGWAEDATFRLPFESRSMGNWFRFDYFDHPDVNGDGSPDCIVDLQLGWLLDPDNGSSITPAAGKYGLVWLNQIQGSGDWERKESYDIPVPLDSAMIGKRFLDVNSDGLPDLVRKTSASDKWVWINTGSSWALEPADSRFQLPEVVSNNGGADMGTRIVDLNGDGHPDFINKWKYGGYPAYDTRVHLGTGDGWDTFSEGAAGPWDLPVAFTTFDKSWTSHSSRSSLVDINADGLVDLVDSKASRNMIYFNTGDGWWESDSGTYWADGSSTSSGGYGLPVPAFRDAWAEYYGWNSGVFLDLNGDGVTDYVSHSETADPKVWINLRGPEFIEAVTDGYDKTLTIEYSRLNDPAPLALTDRRAYTPYDPVVDPLLASGHIGVRNGGYVVTRLIEPDGLGGMKCSRRHYGDLRFDRINQSSLGFGWIEVHDELCLNSGSIISRGYTRTEMSRSYPFAGSPLVVDVFVHIADPIPSQLVGVSAGTKHVSRETSNYAQLDD